MLHCNVVSYILLTLACFQNYDINIRNGYIRNHFGKRKPHAKHSLHFCRRYATLQLRVTILFTKDQLISEGLFDVIVSTKKPMNFFKDYPQKFRIDGIGINFSSEHLWLIHHFEISSIKKKIVEE